LLDGIPPPGQSVSLHRQPHPHFWRPAMYKDITSNHHGIKISNLRLF